MSQNPVNLDRAIATLRQEQPSAEAAVRARRHLLAPARRPQAVRITSLAAACLLAGFIVWPRENSGAAWGKVIAQTNAAPIVHEVSYRKGKVIFERWSSGPCRALVNFTEAGKVLIEMRSDGKRYYRYQNQSLYTGRYEWDGKKYRAARRNPLPNAFESGVVSVRSRASLPRSTEPANTVEGMFKSYHATVVSHEAVKTPEGEWQRYNVRLPGDTSKVFEVDADPKTNLVRQVRANDGAFLTKMEYPSSIDPKIFEPRPQAAGNVPVLDLEVSRQRAIHALKKGLGTRSGMTLRLALIDSEGYLWVLWNGAPPDSANLRPYRLPGLEAGKAFGMRAFTSSWRTEKRGNDRSPITGTHLEGMARAVMSKIGDQVDIEVPKGRAYVRFNAVPVIRVDSIQSIGYELGISRFKRP